MTWAQSKIATACGSCTAVIAEGHPIAYVTVAKLPRCQACVKATYGQEPPTDWPVKEPQPVVTPKVPEFTTVRTYAQRAKSDIDGRMKQVGSE